VYLFVVITGCNFFCLCN